MPNQKEEEIVRTLMASYGDHHQLEVKVRSKSIIKPSSQTPRNLRHFKLSLLDQMVPPSLYIDSVFFYPKPTNTNHDRISALLRDSLSHTLSHFYPLAGRIRLNNNHHHESSQPVIDCNDSGVVYLEAEADQLMSDFLGGGTTPPPGRHILGRLAPQRPKFDVSSGGGGDVPLASFQTTVFRCGGIAIGVSLSHLVADGSIFGEFLRKWAAVARRNGKSYKTNGYAHDMAASLFERNTDHVFNLIIPPFMQRLGKPETTCTNTTTTNRTGTIVAERIVFSREAIFALRSKVKSSQVPKPSRTLAIQGLIWSVAMRSSASTTSSSSPSSIAISLVDLRPRIKTPLPDYSTGNLCWGNLARYDHHPDNNNTTADPPTSSWLVQLLKKSNDKVNGDFIEKLRGEEGDEVIRKLVEERGNLRDYTFSSMVRAGLNEVDLGFGKPLWVVLLGVTEEPLADVVFMIEATPDDDSVEAWVSLDQKEMAVFRHDVELLQYATVNPPINVHPGGSNVFEILSSRI